MTKKEKLEFVRQQLKSFATLPRKHTDEVGWIMLKLSCTREVAERLIAQATR